VRRRRLFQIAAAGAAATLAGCTKPPAEGPAAAPPPPSSPAPSASGVPTIVPTSKRPTTGPLAQRVRFGAWAKYGNGPVDDHVRLEGVLYTKLPVFSWFQSFGAWDDTTAIRIAALRPEQPYDSLLCWEAYGVPFDNINRGLLDRYFSDFFIGAKTYPGRVIIRLFHESNGDWYPWSAANRHATVSGPTDWKRAWRRIVGMARQVEASNVKFMFCPNHIDLGKFRAEDYWPGQEWVDVIGVDGYNRKWSSAGRPQHTAEDIIGPMYHRLTSIHPTAEFMVGEIGSAAHPQKAAWHEALYRSTWFPRLTQIAFFHDRTGANWRLDSDPDTLRINRQYLAPQALE
jgi:hypothetical protein